MADMPEGGMLLEDLKVCIVLLLMHQLDIAADLPVAVANPAITLKQMDNEASHGMESCRLLLLSNLCAGKAHLGRLSQTSAEVKYAIL